MNRILLSLKSKIELLYLSSILIFLVIINYRVLGTWFIVDDTANIFCSSFDTIRLLFDRGTYLFFNQLFFTPLLPISFKLDWFLFKMNPSGYHILNLLAAYLCCFFFYKFQRIYLPSFFSWLGTILLSVSLPISFDISWITRKHYLWGFLFSLIALYLFKRWETNRKTIIIFLSLLSTLLCFLFKEAYAFLPAIIFVVSSGSIKDRAQKALPFFFVLAIYLLWRIYMLGGIGGYPGSTDKSAFLLLKTLVIMPVNLSDSLFGFSFVPFILLILLAFFNFRMLILMVIATQIVISPFIFYPESGFLLANKALSYVALISFALSYLMHSAYNRNKRISVAIVLFIFIPIIFGTISKTKIGQEAIICLSDSYKKASEEIMNSKDEKILVVGNCSYYFSNLEDIYRKMLRRNFPFIRSISDIAAIPYLDVNDFNKIILAKNLDLNPDVASESTVEVLTGLKGKEFITQNLKSKNRLASPEVNFVSEPDRLKIKITDSREGIYLRCLHMGTYVGCYPIPKKYTVKYNGIKRIDRIDIIFLSKDGMASNAASFVF